MNTISSTGKPGISAASGSAVEPVPLSDAKLLQPRTINGTAGYIPYFTDNANDLGNSVIYQSGGNVGIGTTSPTTALQVYGSVYATNTTYTGYGFRIGGPGGYWNQFTYDSGNTYLDYGDGYGYSDTSRTQINAQIELVQREMES